VSTKLIELFSGCGGLSYGAHLAANESKVELEILAAVDVWQAASNTYERNLGIAPRVASVEVPLLESLHEAFPIVDILAGGPPCQGFSTVGKRALDDPRNQLVRRFIDAVRILQPKAFLMENVSGFTTMQKGELFDEVVESFANLGYRVYPSIVLASAYGVPQHRRRCVIVGVADGAVFETPLGIASYVPPVNKKLVLDVRPEHLGVGKTISFGEATSDLPGVAAGKTATKYKTPASNRYQKLMRQGVQILTEHEGPAHGPQTLGLLREIPKGRSANDPAIFDKIPIDVRPTSGFANSYQRIQSTAPAPTITRNFSTPSSANCIHPTANRGLTLREAARCQSFPDSYEFVGNRGERRLQVGNAVPPYMAKALFHSLFEAIGAKI